MQTLIKLVIDFDCPNPEWWEGGGRDLSESILEGFDNNSVLLDRSLAESWLRAASQIAGWEGGMEHAPHELLNHKRYVDLRGFDCLRHLWSGKKSSIKESALQLTP